MEERIIRLENAILTINRELGGIMADVEWLKWLTMLIAAGVIILVIKSFLPRLIKEK